MKPKVLILSCSYPSGPSMVRGIFIQDQVEVLSRVYDVAVLAPRLPEWPLIVRGKGIPKSRIEDCGGIKIYRQEMLLPPKFFRLRTYFYNRLARRGFEKVLSTWGKPNIIHAHIILPGGWVAVNLGREYGIPVVLTEHSGPFSVHLSSEYKRKLVRETLTQVNLVIAVSPAMEKQIQAFHNSTKIRVIGNVIRTEFFLPSIGNSKKPGTPKIRFLSVAVLKKEKGMHYLIEAMRLLAQKGVASHELIIGGDGPIRLRLKGMVKAFGLADRCRFLGMLTRPEVKHWMQQCDVFVLPSLGETFGVVVGEAMASGKPVIATRCGGPEFIVSPETGLLVDAADPGALAGAMNAFISGQVSFKPDVLRQSITERFGEDAFLRNIASIYEQL